jgi:hypothetical protein
MSLKPASPRTSTSPSGGPSPSPSTGPSASNPSLRPKAQTRRRLRASGLADISADRRGRSVISTFSSLSIIYAPLALGAIAIASALATQRLLMQPPGLRLAAASCGPAEACQVTFGGRPCGRLCGRPSGRPCGRPSGRPCGRFALWPKARLLQVHCGFAGFRFYRHIYVATRSVHECAAPSSFSCVLRRPSRRPAIASALATQRFLVEPRRQRLAPIGCGADVGDAHAE